MKSIVLFSGGLDSTVALAIASRQSEETMALSFMYGSTHNFREGQAAEYLAHHYLVPRRVVELPMPTGESALMGAQPIPAAAYVAEGPQPTVVPFRNAVLLSYAVAIAEAEGFTHVWSGQHASDYNAWAYPDCSPEFLGAMAAAVYVGTFHKVRLVFPLIWMTKADVVQVGFDRNVPLKHTYSCYRGGEIHCGECPTCVERKIAFRQSGHVDPTEYASWK